MNINNANIFLNYISFSLPWMCNESWDEVSIMQARSELSVLSLPLLHVCSLAMIKIKKLTSAAQPLPTAIVDAHMVRYYDMAFRVRTDWLIDWEIPMGTPYYMIKVKWDDNEIHGTMVSDYGVLLLMVVLIRQIYRQSQWIWMGTWRTLNSYWTMNRSKSCNIDLFFFLLSMLLLANLIGINPLYIYIPINRFMRSEQTILRSFRTSIILVMCDWAN